MQIKSKKKKFKKIQKGKLTYCCLKQRSLVGEYFYSIALFALRTLSCQDDGLEVGISDSTIRLYNPDDRCTRYYGYALHIDALRRKWQFIKTLLNILRLSVVMLETPVGGR